MYPTFLRNSEALYSLFRNYDNQNIKHDFIVLILINKILMKSLSSFILTLKTFPNAPPPSSFISSKFFLFTHYKWILTMNFWLFGVNFWAFCPEVACFWKVSSNGSNLREVYIKILIFRFFTPIMKFFGLKSDCVKRVQYYYLLE